MATVTTVNERKGGKVNWVTVVPIIIFHILAIGAFFSFSWTNLLAFLIVWWLIGSAGIGLGYHRQLTHRGFQTPDWLKHLLATFGAMALQGSPIDWVTTHRLHHQFCETERDPHSPRHGKFWSHVGWVTVGTSQDNSKALEKKYVPDLLKDEFLVALSKYWYLPTIFAAVILGLIGGWSMIIWGVSLPITLNWHFTWFVNSVTHTWGSRRFEIADDSTNNWWVALLTWGEGWHNNHHAHPTSVRHGLRWYEIDANWMLVKLLQKIGLASELKEFSLKKYLVLEDKSPTVIEETSAFQQQAT